MNFYVGEFAFAKEPLQNLLCFREVSMVHGDLEAKARLPINGQGVRLDFFLADGRVRIGNPGQVQLLKQGPVQRGILTGPENNV